MEQLLCASLCQICQALEKESELAKKMVLVQDLTHFLLTTPHVFQSSLRSWTEPLYSAVRTLFCSRLPAQERKKVFKLTSSLILGFHGVDWFLPPDKVWDADSVKFFNLLSRYTSVETVLLLDQSDRLDSDFLGALLLILEHCVLTLVNSHSLSSHLTADELSSLIVSIRSVAGRMLEFADLHKDSDRFADIMPCIIRLLSLWILEDNDAVDQDAGNVFVRTVASVLCREQPTSSHDLIHAALTSISALPADCVPVVQETESELAGLMTACAANSDPDSECHSVILSFRTYVGSSSGEQQVTDSDVC